MMESREVSYYSVFHMQQSGEWKTITSMCVSLILPVCVCVCVCVCIYIYIYIRLRAACYYPDPIRIKYQKPSVSREKEMGLWSSSSRIMRALQKK
jgi:hypothetical protein